MNLFQVRLDQHFTFLVVNRTSFPASCPLHQCSAARAPSPSVHPNSGRSATNFPSDHQPFILPPPQCFIRSIFLLRLNLMTLSSRAASHSHARSRGAEQEAAILLPHGRPAYQGARVVHSISRARLVYSYLYIYME
jgi:hypothetical protein